MKNFFWIILILPLLSCSIEHKPGQPNVIMIMSDDLGWGDTGFNGNTIIQTPSLDALAAKGVIFNRFYTASPVCSPTRASCLTGRNPYRMNIPTANSGHMKDEEVTLAEVLRRHNYRTGHFGKWHLGTLTTKIKDANRGRPGNTRDFSIPTQHGFDTFFSSESKMPTHDPMIKPGIYNEKIGESPRYGWEDRTDDDSTAAYGTYYWDGKEQMVTKDLEGDDSKVIMDRAIDFILDKKDSENPFFAVIWFHTPHLPVVASEKYRTPYKGFDFKEQVYYGTISAMDEQVGRLWNTLEELGESKNTMLWFCSDNGPENGTPGTSGIFRERKRSLYEGGVRVPAFCIWENEIDPNQKLDFPMFTSDYFPTILDMLEITHQLSRPMDGMSIKSAIDGNTLLREKPMGFLYHKKSSWVTHQHKLVSVDDGVTYELYDLIADPRESRDIAQENTVIVNKMKKDLSSWISSVNRSKKGEDY